MTAYNLKDSEMGMEDYLEHLEYQKSLQVVHWYVLKLPASYRGIEAELQAEVERREAEGEPTFEFFAPTYVPAASLVERAAQRKPKRQRNLLYNYIFIHSSVREIFNLKRLYPKYNFLPRKGAGARVRYPYVSDAEMERFKWVAAAYSNQVPIIEPTPGQLSKGDRVRIIAGQFAGVEATLVSYNGSGRKDIVVRVEDVLWVPLLHVEPGQYELISLNEKSKHLYFQLDSQKYWQGLHQALQQYYNNKESVDAKSQAVANEVIVSFRNLEVDSDVTRCKRLSLLLLAYTALGREEEKIATIISIETLLPGVKSELSRALLYATLYGCTDNYLYYETAHRLIEPWKKEAKLKKNKQQLIDRLKDYDQWLRH